MGPCAGYEGRSVWRPSGNEGPLQTCTASEGHRAALYPVRGTKEFLNFLQMSVYF